MVNIKSVAIVPGFLLIEVMCALVMLTLIAGSIAYCQGKIACISHDSIMHNKAIDIVKTIIHAFSAQSSPTHNTLFTVAHTSQPCNIQEMPVKAPFYITTVDISWNCFTQKKERYSVVCSSIDSMISHDI